MVMDNQKDGDRADDPLKNVPWITLKERKVGPDVLFCEIMVFACYVVIFSIMFIRPAAMDAMHQTSVLATIWNAFKMYIGQILGKAFIATLFMQLPFWFCYFHLIKEERGRIVSDLTVIGACLICYWIGYVGIMAVGLLLGA